MYRTLNTKPTIGKKIMKQSSTQERPIVNFTPKEIREFEDELNKTAMKYGLQLFDLWVITSPELENEDKNTIAVAELSILLRKNGWKERGEVPHSVSAYNLHKEQTQKRKEQRDEKEGTKPSC